jgi:hypothetical protein
MRIHRMLPLALALLASSAGAAAAQDKGKIGITMGYPPSLGLLWHASDKVAIRPEFSMSGSSSESSSSSFGLESDSWTFATGASALFYLHTYDHLRTYVGPRFIYSHLRATSKSSGFTQTSSTTKGDAVGGGGFFGAQYALGDKFRVFGELGFAVDHSTTKTTSGTGKATANAWGTRSSVGVIFYP